MKSLSLKKSAIITTFLCLVQASAALSQPLPWQTNQSQSPDVSQQHQPRSTAAPAQAYAPVATESSDQRTQDDRRLDALATRFYKAKPKDKHIITKLKSIQKDVKAFHAELLQRSYNAVDIIRDTENLEGRVSKQLSRLEAEEKAQAATPTAVATATATPTKTVK